MASLLERAKAQKIEQSRKGQDITDEHIEVAIAWLKDEINPTQIQKAMGRTNSVSSLGLWVREAYRRGFIEETR